MPKQVNITVTSRPTTNHTDKVKLNEQIFVTADDRDKACVYTRM